MASDEPRHPRRDRAVVRIGRQWPTVRPVRAVRQRSGRGPGVGAQRLRTDSRPMCATERIDRARAAAWPLLTAGLRGLWRPDRVDGRLGGDVDAAVRDGRGPARGRIELYAPKGGAVLVVRLEQAAVIRGEDDLAASLELDGHRRANDVAGGPPLPAQVAAGIERIQGAIRRR